MPVLKEQVSSRGTRCREASSQRFCGLGSGASGAGSASDEGRGGSSLRLTAVARIMDLLGAEDFSSFFFFKGNV